MKNIRKFLKQFTYPPAAKPVATKQAEWVSAAGKKIPVFVNEYWTAKQRQANALHEVSYRACFKPQLPAFFIENFTQPGELVLDPFSGRGTTALQAALSGRRVAANDVNPLSRMLCEPRLSPPDLALLKKRLDSIPMQQQLKPEMDLSMFFEKKTLAEILSIRAYLQQRLQNRAFDSIDAWIRMVATNRLTGHSPGFFSVYTLPPNQAASPARQKKINADKQQQPPYRNTRDIILRKSRQLIKNLNEQEVHHLQQAAVHSCFLTGDAAHLKGIKDNTVALTVTSPPFLDVVQYAADNWMRCWFNHIDAAQIEAGITMAKTLPDWNRKMTAVIAEIYRVTQSGGLLAFEVGEVRGGKIKLEEPVVEIGLSVGFQCEAIMINQQVFTKTSNIWNVSNNDKGTNSNRIVIFKKK
ncbi:MAG: site-specific DNA-methyltransferase [Bacteroidetes bacterium]|nr:site-specific DNA-methyltransferase [Bacteroidota bacterium]